MSTTSPLFKVTLMIGYEMHLELHARDEQAAEDIATYLFEQRQYQHFRDTEHDIMDSFITKQEAVS